MHVIELKPRAAHNRRFGRELDLDTAAEGLAFDHGRRDGEFALTLTVIGDLNHRRVDLHHS